MLSQVMDASACEDVRCAGSWSDMSSSPRDEEINTAVMEQAHGDERRLWEVPTELNLKPLSANKRLLALRISPPVEPNALRVGSKQMGA